MSFRNTAAIALLFIALGAYLYFVESEKIRDEAKKETLLGVEMDDVTGVTLEYPDGKIVLAKTGDGWRLREPLEAPADETATENLVRAVVEAELKRTLDGEVGAPATYGLDAPESVVRLALADGKPSPAIRVGKSTPVGYSAYVQIEGESQVKLVPSAFATGMKKEVNDLRDKVVIDFPEDQVSGIAIEDAGETLELVQSGDAWRIEKPAPLAADANEVRSFLSSLRAVRAQDFIDEPDSLESYGLESPRRRITISSGKDGARQELLVGGEGERDGRKELYVQRPGDDTVYALGSYTWTNLGKTASAFRDKTILAFDLETLGVLEVARKDGESFRLVRTAPTASPTPAETGERDAEWAVDGATASKGTQAAQLVGDVHGLKGYEVATGSPTELGLGEPDLVFSLIDRDGGALGRILVSVLAGEEESERRTYAMAEGADVVFRIRDYLYAHLDKKRVDLVETDPPPPAAEPTPP